MGKIVLMLFFSKTSEDEVTRESDLNGTRVKNNPYMPVGMASK